MKTKNKLVLITTLLFFSQVLLAQEHQSTGAIPYMKVEKIHRIVNTLDNSASIAYGHESQSGNTLSMPIPAGIPFTQLFYWAPSTFASSMAANPPLFYYITEQVHQRNYIRRMVMRSYQSAKSLVWGMRNRMG